jgi:hypothetical protein
VNALADSAITHDETFSAPSGFVAMQEGAQIGIRPSSVGSEELILAVGNGMTTGYRCRMYFHDVRDSKPLHSEDRPFTEGWGSGGNKVPRGTAYLTPGEGSTPNDLMGGSIEVILEFFETDVPAQHGWIPFTEQYRVLWSRTYEVSLPIK